MIKGGLASRADEQAEEADEEARDRQPGRRAGTPRPRCGSFATSFVILFTAEWGDLSQLLTAGPRRAHR